VIIMIEVVRSGVTEVVPGCVMSVITADLPESCRNILNAVRLNDWGGR
jgi:molybdopterin-binding protein